MRAELKSVDSPDVDFETYWPEDENCFSFPITLRIGPEGGDASDLFQMTVCTPGWLSRQNAGKTAVLGQNLLIVFGYNWAMIHSYLENRINRLMADDWPALALKLSRFASWEFESYQN
ncbi:immunity 8 family protein [Paraburkholderia sediminicola]|uniref:immunity 8 family protein n=1 Tax=Paraburkholderia TaxID=1822464 RepID=UPI0038BB17CC